MRLLRGAVAILLRHLVYTPYIRHAMPYETIIDGQTLHICINVAVTNSVLRYGWTVSVNHLWLK